MGSLILAIYNEIRCPAWTAVDGRILPCDTWTAVEQCLLVSRTLYCRHLWTSVLGYIGPPQNSVLDCSGQLSNNVLGCVGQLQRKWSNDQLQNFFFLDILKKWSAVLDSWEFFPSPDVFGNFSRKSYINYIKVTSTVSSAHKYSIQYSGTVNTEQYVQRLLSIHICTVV